jgi:hypothetical protein
MYPPDNTSPDTPGYGSEAITGNCVAARWAAPRRTARVEGAPKWPSYLALSPTLTLPNLRREWIEACLALAGAVLGWLTPLLLKQTGSGPSSNFYDCGEDVLCPLFACFGAGLGLMGGALRGSPRPRGVANGERTVAG